MFLLIYPIVLVLLNLQGYCSSPETDQTRTRILDSITVECYPVDPWIYLQKEEKDSLVCCSSSRLRDVSVTWRLNPSSEYIQIQEAEYRSYSGDFLNITALADISCTQTPIFTPTQVEIIYEISEGSVLLTQERFKIKVGSYRNLIIIISSCVGGIAVLILALSTIICIRRRRLRSEFPPDSPVVFPNLEEEEHEPASWTDVDLRAEIFPPVNSMVQNGFRNQGFISPDEDYTDSLVHSNNSLVNQNFSEMPISDFISSYSGAVSNPEPEWRDAELIPPIGLARVLVGGSADLGASQLRVKDGDILQVIGLDLGSGYTAVRDSNRNTGFIPTSSIEIHS